MMGRLSFYVIAALLHCCIGKYNIDDSTLYAIKFNSDAGENDKDLLNNPPSLVQTVTMTTSHNEKYICQLPDEDIKVEAADETYAGPSVLQLLERLFVQSQCAYRLEHYWTYELCHGKYIRQYHEERDGKNMKTTEYFLGYYSKEVHEEKKKELAEQALDTLHKKKPLKKKIESFNMPYYEIVMLDGTLCDLNGQPRITRVHYVCYPPGKNEIYSLKESSTCEYEVVVLTSVLCNHPDYKPEESHERFVHCTPANDKTATKPLNLIAMEAESLKLRSEKMYQADLFQGDKGPGSVRIEIKPVFPEGSVLSLEDEEEESANKDENWPQANQRQPVKPLMDPHIVQEFLLGQYCLYGGSGWWKYEFCYGQKVDQYHEEKGKAKSINSLGRFDLKKHKEWIEQNPNKRPKPIELRKHVSHFYSDGDICDVTGKPRHVEVKLKCKKISDSPSAVSIYLLEPKTCEYVLGVESPLVCDILASADEYGLMHMKSKDDFTTVATSTTTMTTVQAAASAADENRNYVKFTLEDAITDKKAFAAVEEETKQKLVAEGEEEEEK